VNDIISLVLLESAPKDDVSKLLLVGELMLLITSLIVVIGLAGEHRLSKWSPAPEKAKIKHGAFVVLVIIGVAGELISDGIIFTSSHRLQRIQDRESLQSRQVADEARERAANAELVLEKFKAKRILSPKYREEIIGQLGPYKGRQFDLAVVPGDSEAAFLMELIEDALIGADWIPVPWEGRGIRVKLMREGHVDAGLLNAGGVLIQMHSEKVSEFSQPAQILAYILNAAGIEAKAEGAEGAHNTNVNAMHVIVGTKPF
jgi:hypothetical protein